MNVDVRDIVLGKPIDDIVVDKDFETITTSVGVFRIHAAKRYTGRTRRKIVVDGYCCYRYDPSEDRVLTEHDIFTQYTGAQAIENTIETERALEEFRRGLVSILGDPGTTILD